MSLLHETVDTHEPDAVGGAAPPPPVATVPPPPLLRTATAPGTVHPVARNDAPPQSVVPYLRALAESGGSDLHCKVGSPPRVRIDGMLRKLQVDALRAEDTERLRARGAAGPTSSTPSCGPTRPTSRTRSTASVGSA